MYNKTKSEFDTLFRALDPKKRINEYTKRVLYGEGSWAMIKKGKYCHLYMLKDGKYSHYWTNQFDDSKNYGTNRKDLGKKAISTVKQLFEEYNHVTLKKAFGYSDIEIKLMCSPKQFYYTNNKLIDPNKDLNYVSMVDFTAHYPSSAMGKLPDWHTRVTYPGTIQPNEEYPFALYTKSGHIAEYQVFDSHDWVNHRLFQNLFVFKDEKDGGVIVHKAQHPTLDPDQDETILMKASSYSLGPVYEKLYEQRKDNEAFKFAMNGSIGYMATQSYTTFRLAHIRAFIIGRANAKMLAVADSIGLRNIIQICVDGAAYLGSHEQGVNYKALNTLHQEFTGATGRFRQFNCYIIKKDDKIIKVKHGAFDACNDGSDINNPTSLNDVNKWIKTSNKFEED